MQRFSKLALGGLLVLALLVTATFAQNTPNGLTFGTVSTTVATAGTAVKTTTTKLLVRNFTVCAVTGNTGNIFIGGSTVSATLGVPLAPAACHVFSSGGTGVAVDNYDLSSLWLDTATNGNKAIIIYAKRLP